MFEWILLQLQQHWSFRELLFLFNILLGIIAIFVVPRNRHPLAGLTWLAFIFLVPIIGWIVFILLGSPKLPRNRRALNLNVDEFLGHNSTGPNLTGVSGKFKQSIQLAYSLTRMPIVDASDIKIIPDYDDVLDSIIKDIDKAEKTIHLEYYIFIYDSFTERLIASLEGAAKRGLDVKILYDAYGNLKYLSRSRRMQYRLRAAGAKVKSSLPLKLPFMGYTRPDLRNHRKLIVIDSEIAYTGSQNMINKTYHRRDDIVYKELVVRVSGKKTVRQLEAIFAADWAAETGKQLQSLDADPAASSTDQNYIKTQVLPSGPGYEDENNLKVFNSLLYAASESVTIVNPYFVPDESLITAITSAARRGVRVQMINSEAVDQWTVAHAQRSYYEELLKVGVEIYLHKKPYLVHSKFIVIDNEMAIVGSSNLDIRSFLLNHELALLIYDRPKAEAFTVLAEHYKKDSLAINKKDWLERPRFRQLLDNIARLTSALQ